MDLPVQKTVTLRWTQKSRLESCKNLQTSIAKGNSGAAVTEVDTKQGNNSNSYRNLGFF